MTARRLGADLGRDLKLALRRLRAAPGVTIFSIVTLAVGIGLTTGAYSVMYTGLWRPLGLGDESRVVLISRSNMMRPGPTDMTWADFEHLRREQRSLSSVGGWVAFGSVLAGLGTAELVDFEFVTGEYFKAAGVAATRGRTIDEDDDRRDAKPVIVLSDATWRDQFNGDPVIVGKTVKLADRAFEVIGIAPPGFRGVNPQAFTTRAGWIALALAPDLIGPPFRQVFDPGGPSLLHAIGRLKPDVTAEQAKADLVDVGERRDAAAPLQPYRNTPTSPPVPRKRYWTSGLVRDAEQLSADANEVGRIIVVLPGLVLLIACTNLANLVLSRGVSRRHDFAVRRALGASRWRLIREQLIEQGLIAVVGGAAGLGVGYALVRSVANTARETMAPFLRSSRIDWTLDAGVVQATVFAILIALVVFGLIPALHLTRDSLRSVLAQGGTNTTPRWRGRGNLIALQVGVSVGLFLIAVVFIRILLKELPQPNLAVSPALRQVAVAAIPFGSQQRDEARGRETIDRVLAEARKIPGVDAIAVTSDLPFRFVSFGSTFSISVTSIDRPFVPPKQLGVFVLAETTTPETFAILDQPLRSGRVFDGRDTAAAAPAVVVNEGLAQLVFGTADVAGKPLLMRVESYVRGEDPRVEQATIVGVVAGGTPATPRARATARLYMPLSQRYGDQLAVLARFAPGRDASAAALRDAIRRVDPELALSFASRADVLSVGPLAFAPYLAALLTLLAFLSLALAMAGLYGVLSHVVARRTREMGVRIALGAQPRRIVGLVLKDGFRPIAEGLFIGLASAAIVRVLMKVNLSLAIGPIDPVACVLAIVLLILAGSIACYLPARRASRVDPNVVLRDL